VELTGESMAVHAEICQRSFLAAKSLFNREAGFEAREIDIDAARRRGDVEQQQVAFEDGDAIHAPRGVGEVADELLFGGGFGLVLVDEGLGVKVEGGGVFGGEDGGLAGESVGGGVEGRVLFTDGGARAGGVLGVGAVDDAA